MPQSKHYSPAINRFLVSVLYHEARAKRVPMTSLVNQILTERLTGGDGWRRAMLQLQEQAQVSGTR